ncbi:MAG: DUF389 domain-containing protein [Myxococcota bacterium]
MSLPPPTPPEDPQPAAAGDPHPLVFLRKSIRKLQNAIAAKLGIDPGDREALVAEMLSRQEEDALSYWLQLFLSIGIATLGLVLDGTGVVIGAMLISPLMTPIVGLGMGFTTGSPFLTLRSAVRVGASVAVVIGVAAILTRMLPFHEITGEIAGRTAPTLIDLGIASFCALAAGFTTVRHSSDTVAAAAGTAIGIALVPPLCVSGFGFGIVNAGVAFGAALLFTANLCAIVFFTVLLFYCIGYNQLDVSRLESDNVKTGGRVTKLAAALRRAFTTRYGPLLRFLLPLALVTGVFFPLSRALTEVAWKVRVQTEVAAVLEEVIGEDDALRSAMTVEHGQVAIRLVLVASPERAAEIEDVVTERVAAIASTVPTVDVHAVPDIASLPQLSSPTPVLAPTASGPDLEDLRTRVEGRLARWPRGADAILQWGLGFDGEDCVVEVVHVGTPGGEFLTLLGDTLEASLERPVIVRERAIELSTWTAADDDIVGWLPDLTRALQSAQAPGISACVTAGPQTRVEMRPAPVPVAPVPTPTDPGPEPSPVPGELGPDPTGPDPTGPDPTGPEPTGPEPTEPEPVPAPPPREIAVDVDIPGATTAAALLQPVQPDVVVSQGKWWSVSVVRGTCSDE